MAISIPTVTGTLELGGKITIKTNREKTTYRHTLYYSWGSQLNDVFVAENIGDSYEWTIPKELANYIITATKGTLFLKLTTNEGSTYLGSKTISIVVSMPNTDEFKPKISSITLEEIGDVAASVGVWVQKRSKLKGTLNIVNAYGTSAESYTIEVNGTIYKERIFSTEYLANSGTNSIKATVVDKRGRSTTKTIDINVVEYNNPYISSASVVRASSSSATLKLVGGISPVNNKNAKKYYYKYKKKESDYYSDAITISNDAYTIDKSITVTGLEDTQYDFLVGIQDSYTATEKGEMGLASTTKVFNVSKDKKKFAFFGKAVKNGLQVFASIFDRFGTEIRNGLALYESSGSTDVNTTLEELVLSSYNTPTSSLWYVRTMFYSTKSTTTNRTQIAWPYNASNPTSKVYYRYYVSGTGWSEWVAIGGKTTDNGIIKIGQNICIQYGSLTARVDTGNTPKSIAFNFNTPFATCYELIPVLETSAVSGCQVCRGSISASGATIWFNRTNTSATIVHWIAIGKLE